MSSNLVDRLKENFDPTRRVRGEVYFEEERVEGFTVSGETISAKIRGSDIYSLRLHRDIKARSTTYTLTCSCPDYESGIFCKHGWALVLKMEDEGVSDFFQGTTEVELVHTADFDDDVTAEDKLEPENYEPLYADKKQTDKRQTERQPPVSQALPARPTSRWSTRLREIRSIEEPEKSNVKPTRLAYFRLNAESSRELGSFVIEFLYSEKKNQDYGVLKTGWISVADLHLFEEPQDRELLAALLPYGDYARPRSVYGKSLKTDLSYQRAVLSANFPDDLLQKLCETSRFFLETKGVQPESSLIEIETGEPWSFHLQMVEREHGYILSGYLKRLGEVRALTSDFCMLDPGFMLIGRQILKLHHSHHRAWMTDLQKRGPLHLEKEEMEDFLRDLSRSANIPPVTWPENFLWKTETTRPRPSLMLDEPRRTRSGAKIRGLLRFRYGDIDSAFFDSKSLFFDESGRRLLNRDFDFEGQALETLKNLQGLEIKAERGQDLVLEMDSQIATQTIRDLLSWGWDVRALNRQLRVSEGSSMNIKSGVDWFELSSDLFFDDRLKLSLPQVIKSLEENRLYITLSDGTLGLLPENWLSQHRALLQLGTPTKEGLKFSKSQSVLMALMLDQDLDSSSVEFDELKARLRDQDKITPPKLSTTFKGALRPYQEQGLSWLNFLEQLNCGGVLADDMGLGKTVQVLAHLNNHYQKISRKDHRPSIIVVPKSLLFNWRLEAEKFTPKLKVLILAGPQREQQKALISSHDIVLVTYATLRLEVSELLDHEFHYVIADEAQAIKNPESQIHKACRLLKGAYRLAMTGTPIENSANDLLSIFGFCNPGMLGRSLRTRFKAIPGQDHFMGEDLSRLAVALRPFILRRTKSQVLDDLPEKTESQILCELEPKERDFYNDLRDHYRIQLKGMSDQYGVEKNKIMVLEALLRLRQAACHPGLVDSQRRGSASTKIETLMEHLQELVAEGHKALVFSQFTSLLDLVEPSLEQMKIPFVRLDGKTTLAKRQVLVDRFQRETALPVFLMSVKAGGVGLNLTAADYVFILDPWWNPAVEQQAIDRTHRMGQKNKVFAYRLIAKDTVEEKIIELQKRKKELAKTLVLEDVGFLKSLNAKDIDFLFS